MLYLSKSKYCNAVQCPKMLWMNRNMPEAGDASARNEKVLETGSAVGDLAMGMFGEFIEVPQMALGDMIQKTEQLLLAGTEIIAEASFSYNGLFCSVDILKNLGGGHVELYEVKSSTHVAEIYKHDVAYQTYVLRGLGYQVDRVCLVHIDNTYVRHGDLELDKLFKIEDLTETAIGMQAEVAERISRLEIYMQQTTEPEMPLGEHCSSPYDCPFWQHCSRNLPKPNVFDITGMSLKKKVEVYQTGFVTFADVLQNVKLTPRIRQPLEFAVNDLPDFIDTKAIHEFMQSLHYPLYFLDFESYQPAVPLFDDSRPFQQIVFQYSLHYIEAEGEPLQHREFLAQPGCDPRRTLAEQLCRDIPLDVCTTAYNMSFEKTQIKGLAEIYPDLHDHLMNIHDHIVDLRTPFQKRWYYTKEMAGSDSIKHVLPALFPNDPALDYQNLEGVKKGDQASAAFEAMSNLSPAEQEKLRKELLTYCGLDTYAMVKLWEKLAAV